MRMFFFTISLLLPMCINAQPLEPFISTQHNGSVTFVAMNYIDDALWVSGNQQDNGKGIVWKYNDDGVVLDSIVFAAAERQTFYNFVPYGDSVVVIGTQSLAENGWQLVMHCLDKNLNRIWTKTFDYPYNPYVINIRTFQHFNRRFIAIQTPKTRFFKLDNHFNVLDTKEVYQYNYEPIKYTERGFIFSKNGGWVVEVDTTFNEIDTLFRGYGIFTFGGNLISNGKTGYIHTTKKTGSNYKINYLDSDFQVMRSYPYFGHQDEEPRYTFYRSMLPKNDTSIIFASGLINYCQDPHLVHFGSYVSNRFWVSCLNQDSLLWYRYYEDSIYYYITLNMTRDSDGSVYISASRYNAIEQPDYSDAVIFKFSAEGDMLVGIQSEQKMQNAIKAYPNPGTNKFNIEMQEPTNSTITLYNTQGKLMQTKLFRGKCQINTERLMQGVYFYRVVTESGDIYTGKWVKK